MGIDSIGAGLPAAINKPELAAAQQTANFAAQMEQAAASAQTAQAASKTSFGKTSSTPAEDHKLREACRGMEAVFLNMMLTRMRATVPKSELLGKNSQEEVMQSMLDTETTKNMAQAGGMGLADMLYRQLSISPTAPAKKQTPTMEG